jgi:hypothetical protein
MKLSFEQKESGRHNRTITAQKSVQSFSVKTVFIASALMKTESKRMFQKEIRDHFHICINFTAQEFNRRKGNKNFWHSSSEFKLIGN